MTRKKTSMTQRVRGSYRKHRKKLLHHLRTVRTDLGQAQDRNDTTAAMKQGMRLWSLQVALVRLRAARGSAKA